MGGGIGEDPHVTGDDGSFFYFLGVHGGWYACFSVPNLQVNIRTDILQSEPGASKVGAVAIMVGTISDPARIMFDLGDRGNAWTLTMPRYNPFASGLTHPDAAGLNGSVSIYDPTCHAEVSAATWIVGVRRDWGATWFQIPDPVPHLDLWIDRVEAAKDLDFPGIPSGVYGQTFGVPDADRVLDPAHWRVSGPFAYDNPSNRFGVLA